MSDTRSLWRRNPLRGRFLAAGETPASILCLPNVISLVRILLIPVFLWLLIADAAQQVCTASIPSSCGVVLWPLEAANGPLRWAAAIVFILAIATDAIDGHLARSRNLVTDLGIFLDPVADKGITGAALIGLALIGELPWWAVGLILLREIGITVYRAVALKDRVIPASRGGKLKTLVQAVAISYWLVPFAALVAWDDAAGASASNLLVLALDAVHWILLVLVVVITLWTGIDYLVQGSRAARRDPVASDDDAASGTNARGADGAADGTNARGADGAADGTNARGADGAAEIVAAAARRGARIAVAESLTGGTVLAALVDIPGASAVLRGGIVAYATELKHTLLDVPAGLLAARGAVDPDVAEAMALGALRRTGADLAVATTGVAGPEPQDGQPVGLVYIGVASTLDDLRPSGDLRSLSERSESKGRPPALGVAAHRFAGDRATIRAAATRAALEALRDAVGPA